MKLYPPTWYNYYDWGGGGGAIVGKTQNLVRVCVLHMEGFETIKHYAVPQKCPKGKFHYAFCGKK